MAKRYQWPHCTVRGCECTRTWGTERQAESAFMRHSNWTHGNQAICACHGLQGGATFPCDKSLEDTHSV